MFLASETAHAAAHAAQGLVGPATGDGHAAQLLPWVILLPLIGAFINGVFGSKLKKSTVTAIGE